jgi:hypothetical protein
MAEKMNEMYNMIQTIMSIVNNSRQSKDDPEQYESASRRTH